MPYIPMILYRGVCKAFDEEKCGLIKAKESRPFVHEWTMDSTEITLDNTRITWQPSTVNAIHYHQASQKGYPTSGISTTPHRHRAEYYARSGPACKEGYIYTIDGSQLAAYGIEAYVVKDHVTHPAVPEDDEVILAPFNGEPLPEALIISKDKVGGECL